MFQLVSTYMELFSGPNCVQYCSWITIIDYLKFVWLGWETFLFKQRLVVEKLSNLQYQV